MDHRIDPVCVCTGLLASLTPCSPGIYSNTEKLSFFLLTSWSKLTFLNVSMLCRHDEAEVTHLTFGVGFRNSDKLTISVAELKHYIV